ncbi:MAG: hypothetical protein COB67_00035 [SAR324 cluster bacterium]|uniref:Uncharacterized protein n=1 Tax=SAR324 cluster bacterium TaxID=2024889 RepID=A0A2A4TBH1_9DELT|nr:MAG: hypothetical protein COB67_00035 [SAR324 cluster bacterium]
MINTNKIESVVRAAIEPFRNDWERDCDWWCGIEDKKFEGALLGIDIHIFSIDEEDSTKGLEAIVYPLEKGDEYLVANTNTTLIKFKI